MEKILVQIILTSIFITYSVHCIWYTEAPIITYTFHRMWYTECQAESTHSRAATRELPSHFSWCIYTVLQYIYISVHKYIYIYQSPCHGIRPTSSGYRRLARDTC